jgi:hypothetical protein
VAANTWEVISKEEFLNSYQKALEWFNKTQKYKVSLTYESFINENVLTSYDRSTGVYIRDGNKTLTNILGIKTVKNDFVGFSVDTTEKIIIINNIQNKENDLLDVKTYDGFFTNIKSLKKQKSKEGLIIYRIEFKPDLLYSSFEIQIGADGLLKKQTFFYSFVISEDEKNFETKSGSDKNSSKDKPRLEISFTNYQTQVQSHVNAEFSEKKYFTLSGKKAILTEQYKGYRLKDYRFDLKK